MWHTLYMYYIIFSFLNYILSPSISHVRISRMLFHRKSMWELDAEMLLFTLYDTHVPVFSIICLATLSPSAIDRSRGAYTHCELRLLIHGCTGCGHVDIYEHTLARIYARIRERSRKDESTSFARVPTCILVFPRCYANERASRSSKMAILGRTSSLLRQRFDRTEIEDVSLDVEGKRDSLSLYDFYIKIQQLDHLGSPWQKSFPSEILFSESKKLV